MDTKRDHNFDNHPCELYLSRAPICSTACFDGRGLGGYGANCSEGVVLPYITRITYLLKDLLGGPGDLVSRL